MESNDQHSVDGLTEDSELSDVQASKRTKGKLSRITSSNETMDGYSSKKRGRGSKSLNTQKSRSRRLQIAVNQMVKDHDGSFLILQCFPNKSQYSSHITHHGAFAKSFRESEVGKLIEDTWHKEVCILQEKRKNTHQDSQVALNAEMNSTERFIETLEYPETESNSAAGLTTALTSVQGPRTRSDTKITKTAPNLKVNRSVPVKEVVDAMHKVYEMAYDSRDTDDEFVKYIQMVPQYVTMAYNEQLAEQFRRVSLKNKPQCLIYRTMIRVNSNFNASILLFRQIEFVEAPVIPLVVMFHQQLTANTHSIFWENICQHFPELKSQKNSYLVTSDGSKEMITVVTKILPNMEVFRCPENILTDVEAKLKSIEHLQLKERNKYHQQLKDLFSQPSRLLYMEKLTSYMISWDRDFCAYFHSYIHPNIDRIGIWGYTKYGVTSCVTTKLPDLMYSTIERIREWREASIDTIIVCFNHLFKNYNAELTKSHYGSGNFTLQPDLTAHYHKTKQAPQLQSVKSADEIVRRVRQSCEPNNSPAAGQLTENQLAKELLQNGTIKFDFKHGKFTIQDTEGDYLVQLFPKPSCTCPHAMASASCSHILACQISIGLNNEDSTDPSDAKNNQMNEVDHNYLSSLATLSAVASKHHNELDYSPSKEADVSEALCVCVTEVKELIEEAVSPNVTVIEESSIPMVVATTNAEGNMEATNADGSNFKIYFVCDSDQSLPTTSIAANEEVNMEP